MDRFYIEQDSNTQQIMDRQTGRCLGSEALSLREGETFWERDSRMFAQVSWCAFLNRRPECAIPHLHPVAPAADSQRGAA